LRSLISALPEVLEYQIEQRGRSLSVALRLREGAPHSITDGLRYALGNHLRAQGADAEVIVRVVAEIAREGGAAKQSWCAVSPNRASGALPE
jgi:hypothetical protein